MCAERGRPHLFQSDTRIRDCHRHNLSAQIGIGICIISYKSMLICVRKRLKVDGKNILNERCRLSFCRMFWSNCRCTLVLGNKKLDFRLVGGSKFGTTYLSLLGDRYCSVSFSLLEPDMMINWPPRSFKIHF